MGARTLAIGVFFAAGILLAACAGPAAQPAAGPETQARAQPQPEPQLQCDPGKEHWRSRERPIRGGTIKRDEEVPVLDPTAPGGRAGYHAGIYEYLVRPRSCYYADNVMVPNLARSWEFSPDGLTWTLKLREGVRYQNRPPLNGRPFTSADVVWTIEYLKKESDLRSYWTNVTHEAPDDRTVVLRFKEPDSDFLYKLGDERQVMLPREIKEQYGDFKSVAVGTGAFMQRSLTPNQVLIAERNPDYYVMGADGKPLPYVDEFHSLTFPEMAGKLAALRTGQLDHTHGAQIRKFEQDAIRQGQPKHRYYADPAATVFGLWYNPQAAPWNDVRVRRALSLAIDRDDLIASERGDSMFQGFVPQTLDEWAWSPEKLREKFPYDPEKAKQLLREAGFSQARELRFRTGSTYAQQLEVLARHFELAGIRTRIEIGPGNASGPIIRDFDYDLAWGPPGGGRFLDYWVGDLVRSGAGRNVSRFNDPRLDAMVDAQKREMDAGKRKQLIAEIQDYMYEQMPYVPAIGRVHHGVLHCRVQNMFPNPQSTNYYGFQEAWIDASKC